MIGYIKGKVLYHTGSEIVLENNGIGYEVFCSASAAQSLLSAGQGEVYTLSLIHI